MMQNDLERRRASLSDAQRALLEQRMRGRSPVAGGTRLIRPRTARGAAPLSFPQQRLWFLEKLLPGLPVYNEQLVLPIRFALKRPALERTINEIIRRHEILRTHFIVVNGEPAQVVEPERRIVVAEIDLRAARAETRQAEAQRIAAQDMHKSFDFSTGPLIRASLLLFGQDDSLLLVTVHHLIWDGWSINVFLRELSAVYGAFAAGAPSPLPPLPIQYADFAVWQRDWLTGGVLEAELAYWRGQLRGLSTLQLPTDHPRPPTVSFDGSAHNFRISAEDSIGLKALSQLRRTTLFVTLVAAFVSLLHRYSHQTDVVIGTPVANRHRARELEDLLGFFVNTLVLRFDASGDPTFLEFLERAREVTLSAQEHQDLPFEKLVEDLHPQRDLSRNPLCQVAFQLINQPGGAHTATDAADAPFIPGSGTSKFDLRLDVVDGPGGLSGNIEFSLDLFNPETVVRMAGHFQRLLHGIVSDPSRRLSELPLLTEQECDVLELRRAGREKTFNAGECLPAVIDRHAVEQANAPALVFDGAVTNYRTLVDRANGLASVLLEQGVAPGQLIGLHLRRGPDLYVALLAVWKTRAAYVPLDPSYPLDRLRFMVSDAGLTLILTESALGGRLAGPGVTEVALDRVEHERDGRPAASFPMALPTDPAYAIFTSGSTGMPKGVLLDHAGLINVAEAQARTFGLDRNARVLQFASFSFDASLFEIVMALYNGAALYTGPSESLMPGRPLLDFLAGHEISIVTLPPGALAALSFEPLPALRTITVAGDACPPALVATWAPGRSFFNLYGPTEATIWSTFARCTPGAAPPPIGRPIPHTTAWALDGKLQPVPIGVPGELYIGGMGVARCYLNRPDLTAERFLPDPYAALPGRRMYRTGDVVRAREDGSFEFLGRVDHQVKVRGYRIELEEIEAALAAHPDILQAAAFVKECRNGQEDRQLAAGFVARPGRAVPAAELRNALRAQLPEFMVPAHLVALDGLPLSPNGKIDRRALASYVDAVAPAGTSYVRPETRVEILVADVWREILGVEQVGLHDNFFDLGGHSLLLNRVHVRLSELVASDLTMVDLFQYPTVALLAQRLARAPEPTGEPMPDIDERAQRQKEARRRRRVRMEDESDE